MIYTAVLVYGDVPRQLIMPRDCAAVGRINDAKSAELRQSRSLAYTLAERAYRDIYSSDMPKLCFSEGGKPYFVNGEIKLSVSHTDGVCAVTFAKRDVGVDVQAYSEMLGKEGVLKRFVNENLQNLIKKQKPPQICYLF